MKKRLPALIITAALIVSLLPANVFAAESDESDDWHGLQAPYYTEDGTYYMGEPKSGDEDELDASIEEVTQIANSKKGFQENQYRLDPDYESLGVKQVLRNVRISDYIKINSAGGYYLDTTTLKNHYEDSIMAFNEEGIEVTLVILMDWKEELQELIYSTARVSGKKYYELNTQDAVGKAAWTNIFNSFVQTFSSSGCYVSRYVLSNEVNQMGDGYNYTGTPDAATNIAAYTSSFAVLAKAVQTYSPAAGAYISLDHTWNLTSTGISSHVFLDTFASLLSSIDSSLNWNVAWHAYGPSLVSSASLPDTTLYMWKSSYCTDDINTYIICGCNLSVLTDYIKTTYGSSHRIILSEQGYDASYREADQAVFIAYTFLAAQYNDMVDAVHFRSYLDYPEEDGLCFGIVNGNETEMNAAADPAAYVAERKRQAYDVFKYMDTDQASLYIDSLLSIIGVSSWAEIIPGYSPYSSLEEGFNYIGDEKVYVKDGQVVTGWRMVRGRMYYFDPETGYAVKGLQTIGGYMYYFDSNGVKQTGWETVNGSKMYFNIRTGGQAVIGPCVISGEARCFDSNGVLRETYSLVYVNNSIYWVDHNGIMRSGWLKGATASMYFDPETYKAATGTINIGRKTYTFDSSGNLIQ